MKQRFLAEIRTTANLQPPVARAGGAITALWEVLPGGRHAVGVQAAGMESELVAIDLETGQVRRLDVPGVSPEYLPPGYLLHWTSGSTVVASPPPTKRRSPVPA